jgi:hypothetical protein
MFGEDTNVFPFPGFQARITQPIFSTPTSLTPTLNEFWEIYFRTRTNGNNKPSGTIKCREILDYLSNCYFLKGL